VRCGCCCAVWLVLTSSPKVLLPRLRDCREVLAVSAWPTAAAAAALMGWLLQDSSTRVVLLRSASHRSCIP
jgi:hypothetical protein